MVSSTRAVVFPILIGLLACAATLTQAQQNAAPKAPRQLTTLFQFAGATDGSAPLTRLVADKSGALYGTAATGGTQGLGNVFQMSPPQSGGTWTHTVLYSFGAGTDGAIPESSLTIDQNGNLYGTTYQGGTANLGTVYMLTPPTPGNSAWTETVLYSFHGGDGRNPYGGVVLDKSGNLYGTTQQGGPYLCTRRRLSCGTIYQLSPPGTPGGAWTEAVLYSFQGRADGAFPDTTMAMDGAGNLYGTTTYSGGTNPRFGGLVFQLIPAAQAGGPWTFNTLFSFLNIGQPSFEGDLVLDAKGALYGTSWDGGAAGMGFVYRLTPPAQPGTAWAASTLWSFSGMDGSLPQGGVILGPKGILYGTTYSGGDLTKCNGIGCGVVFRLKPPAKVGGAWQRSVLYSFQNGSDGAAPQGALLLDTTGALVGTTSAGAAPPPGGGTIFSLK